MKNNNVKNLVNKVVNEEFMNKIKSIKNRIFENKEEMEEGFDDPYVKRARGGKDFSKREFRKIPKGAVDLRRSDRDDSVTIDKFNKNQFKDIFGDMDDDFEGDFSEGMDEKCECGGMMYEGECMECGKSGMYEAELDEFEDEDFLRKADEYAKKIEKDEYDKKREKKEREDYIGTMYQGDNPEVMKQMALHNPEHASDYYDVHMKRKMKGETKEGKKFPDLSGDGKVTRKDVLLGRGVKLDGKKKTNESEIYQLTIDGKKHYFTESEMVDVIEKIVIEEAKKGSNPKNVTKYSQDRSKSENEKNIADVTKKMKEYLKNQSKGSYEANPKHFPKGNGELGEMSKKAYKASNAVEEYVENFTAAALENLDYDDIKPNEKWVEDNMVGSSKTGNNPEWANAVETEVNEKRNKIRKDNLLAKMKKKAYNKAPQPVNDVAGENTDKVSKIMMKLESVEDKKVINEIEKMKDLITYKKKTQ